MIKRETEPSLKEPKIATIEPKHFTDEKIYCLTPHGVQLVAGDLDIPVEDVKAPRSIPKEQTTKLAGHDKHAIDCYIEFFETCEKYDIEIRLNDYDMDTLGSVRTSNNLQRKTRLATSSSYLEPDGVFKISTPRGMLMYLFEMEMRDARNHKDLIEKIDKYVDCLNVHSVKEKYNFSLSPRILIVFKERSTMEFVLDHLKENIQNGDFWFLCKLYEDVVPSKDVVKGTFHFGEKKNFFKDWVTTGGVVDMF